MNPHQPPQKQALIYTASGKLLDLMDPKPENISIEDIAHGLAHVCRFSGQCPIFYSVASHSIAVSKMVGPEYALAALLHDASEFAMSDIPSPLKAHLPEYMEIEDHLMSVIALKFGFQWPLPQDVKDADRHALQTEQKLLWDCQESIATSFTPLDTARKFIKRFNEIISFNPAYRS